MSGVPLAQVRSIRARYCLSPVLLFVANVQNFVFAKAARRLDLSHITRKFSDEGASNRGVNRDLSCLDVSFIFTDDLIADLYA